MLIAQERAEAVVSCPARRKVISWLTRSVSLKPPDIRATERMSFCCCELLDFERICFFCWIRSRQVFWMTRDAARMSLLRFTLG